MAFKYFTNKKGKMICSCKNCKYCMEMEDKTYFSHTCTNEDNMVTMIEDIDSISNSCPFLKDAMEY